MSNPSRVAASLTVSQGKDGSCCQHQLYYYRQNHHFGGLSQLLLQATQRLFNTREGRFSLLVHARVCTRVCMCVRMCVCAYLRSQQP